jgi:CBS domain containing-hemolysin-like protein
MSEFLLLHGAAIVMLILANGFFVAAELALVSVRATRVEQLIHTGDARALLVKKLQENLGDFLPAVQLGVTLCSLALGWIGEPFIADLLRHWMAWLPDAHVYGRIAALALAFAGITYFQVLVGELVPKALALHRTDQMVLGIAGPMDFFIRISRPVVRLMNSSAALVLRAFGAPIAHQGGVHSSEELMLMATAARRMGVLPEFEETLIHRSLELDELLTREIMTPRQQIFALPFDLPIEQASARIVAEMHSRIPVYDPARGHEFIVGVVYAKDIARLMHFRASAQTRFSSPPFSGMLLRQVMREVLVVPETKPVLDLMREFQQRRRHLAIVVDEYGSTIGLVTVEDAIEQLIGEVEDEFDVAPPSLLARTSGELMLDGSVTLRDLETQMHWDLPREGGVETLAGFVLAQLGRIPEQGESIVYDGRRLTVMEMEGNRISRIRVQQLPSMKDDSEDAAEA